MNYQLVSFVSSMIATVSFSCADVKCTFVMCRGLLANGVKLKQSQADKVQVIEEV